MYLFLKHKIHKVHEIYKTSLHYYTKIKSISIFDMFDNKVNLMGMHWVHQFADSSFYDAIQEF